MNTKAICNSPRLLLQCGAYLSARQKKGLVNRKFPLAITVQLGHRHADKAAPTATPWKSMSQIVAAHAALAAVPGGLSLGHRQAVANEQLRAAGGAFSANDQFDAWTNASATRTQTLQLGRMWVLRNHDNGALKPAIAADNAVDAVVKHALERGATINADSRYERALFAVAVPLLDGEQAVVMVTEIGFRAVAALAQTGQPVVVFSVDDTHGLLQSPESGGDMLVLTLVVRICGVAVPLAHAAHVSQTQAAYEAIFRVIEEQLRLKQLLQQEMIRVSFMSDDSDAQRNAIRTVFGPNVRLLQCIFHVFKNLRQRIVQDVAQVQTGADGVLLKVGPIGKQVYEFIRSGTACTNEQLQQMLDDVYVLVKGERRTAHILTERADLIRTINAMLTQHVNKQKAKPKGPSHQRRRKKAVAATTTAGAGAADDDDDEAPPGDPLDNGNVAATPDSPLIKLVYEMIMAPTAKEFKQKKRELLRQALLCGMGDYVYHYLFGGHGYLSDKKKGDIVFFKTKDDHWGDLTNNLSEQIHRVYADYMLHSRKRARGLLELIDMLITFQHSRIVQNLSQAVYAHSDSSPYRHARDKSLALDRRVRAVPASILAGTIKVTGDDGAVQFNVPSLSDKDTQHSIVVNYGVLYCNCKQWLRRRRCLHVAIVESKFQVAPPPFLTDLMDARRKQLLKYIAVGPHATPVHGTEAASSADTTDDTTAATTDDITATTADSPNAATTADYATAATTDDHVEQGGFADADFADDAAPQTATLDSAPTAPADLEQRLQAAFQMVSQMDTAGKVRFLAQFENKEPAAAPDNPRRKRSRVQKKGKQSRF